MSKADTHNTSSQGSILRLQKIVDDIEPVLDQETFFTQELPGDMHDARRIAEIMKICGAIKSIERTRPDDRNTGSMVNKWQWVQHRERLQEYLQDRDELPCGCRSHVPPERDDQGRYICKFCGAKHSRETIKGAL